MMLVENRELFKDLRKKTSSLFVGHWPCFIEMAGLFLVPVLIFKDYLWRSPWFVPLLVDTFSMHLFPAVVLFVKAVFVLYFLLFLAAVIKAIAQADRGGNPQAISSYRQAMGILDAYLWVKILFVFKVFCWSLLLVVPGIIFGVFYNFAGMALAVDGIGGVEALRHSKKIIKNNLSAYLLSVTAALSLFFLFSFVFLASLDTMIAFFLLQGNDLMAQAVDYLEIALVTMGGIVFLVFYYYLYQAIKGRGGYR